MAIPSFYCEKSLARTGEKVRHYPLSQPAAASSPIGGQLESPRQNSSPVGEVAAMPTEGVLREANASLFPRKRKGERVIPKPEAPREFRGVWVASVDNIDWPSRKDLSVEQARAELYHVVDVADQLKLNAILFQVRPVADALYPSPMEPWSEFLTGQQGNAPKPMWDPLQEIVAYAHSKGIEVHAWLNPFRAWHPAEKGWTAPNWIGNKQPSWVKTFGNLKWLDPGIPEARAYSLKVVQDIVRRYNVDGVHVDDYFYPYPIKNTDFPDANIYNAYKANGGKLNKQAWRRNNVNQFIGELYRSVHEIKPWVKVGISPFGVYRPGIPEKAEASVDQFKDMGSDPLVWLKSGQCDYLSPQLYWKTSSVHQNFGSLLHWWASQNFLRRHMWPGLFTSRLVEGKWDPSEITGQIDRVRQERMPTQGHCHFSWKMFNQDARGINEKLAKTYSYPAFVPDSPWLRRQVPTAPSIKLDHGELSWKRDNDILAYCLGTFDGTKWTYQKLPSDTTRYHPAYGSHVVLIAIGYGGAASQSEIFSLKEG